MPDVNAEPNQQREVDHAFHYEKSKQFFALADPTRVEILERIAKAPANPTELSQQLGMSLPTVLHHLNALVRGGLVVSLRNGRNVFYSLKREHVSDMKDFLVYVLGLQRAITNPLQENTSENQ